MQRGRKRTVQVTCAVQHQKSILSCERTLELVLPAEDRAPASGLCLVSVSLKPVVKAGVEQMAVGCGLSEASLTVINS